MEKVIAIPHVQIGEKVREVFEARNMKLAEFADRLGTVRQNVYRIFKKKDLDTGLLIKISEVLNHNFFHYYRTAEPGSDAANREIEEYRNQLSLTLREIDYLKRIINLMEEKAKLLQAVKAS